MRESYKQTCIKVQKLEKNKNSKDVGMALKGQKQEGMSCDEVRAVCGFFFFLF